MQTIISARCRQWCCVALFLTVVLALPSQATLTDEECRDWGFEKESVRCSLCSKLFLMTQSETLQRECEGCCTTVGDTEREDQKYYVSARVEGRSIALALADSGASPLAFFKRTYQHEPYFRRISFVEKSSAMFPRVVLVGDDHKDVLTLRISGWSAETLHELFKKKLRVD